MFRELTIEECNTNKETQKHIDTVRKFIDVVISELVSRKELHDKTKLELPEVEIFTKYTPLLAETTYGSDTYKKYLSEMKSGALDHHYKHNRHHPEYYEEGISGMSLIDIIEMFCDWKAASMRHNDGDIRQSIKLNQDRFNISAQLTRIFQNTVRDLNW